jgi:hypothetical protein
MKWYMVLSSHGSKLIVIIIAEERAMVATSMMRTMFIIARTVNNVDHYFTFCTFPSFLNSCISPLSLAIHLLNFYNTKFLDAYRKSQSNSEVWVLELGISK